MAIIKKKCRRLQKLPTSAKKYCVYCDELSGPP